MTTATSGASIELNNVSVLLDQQAIVSGINLRIDAGEFVCLLGPSGCGKSTLLNAIAGFIPYGGQILVNGDPVRGPAIGRGMVFQSSDVLFPWLTASENVQYGQKIRRLAKPERKALAQRYLELVGLGHAIDKFPGQLSGGMRQRLQLARVLVNEPAVVLMDEPFGALDAQTREVMQRELTRIWQATGATIVFVTHDINEALLLADRVATMTTGPRAGIKSVRLVAALRPRDETDPELLSLVRGLRAEIGEEVQKVLRRQGLEAVAT